MDHLDQAWESLKKDFDAVLVQHARSTRDAVTAQLNQLFRRLRNYKNESDWLSIVLESASLFAAQAALFEVQGDRLVLRAERGMNLPPALDIEKPAAMAAAIETKDPVVALRSASEVGPDLSLPNGRARLIPIANAERVAALLFVPDSIDVDTNALELIGGIASAVLERKSNTSLHAQIQLNTAAPARKITLPSWGELSDVEQALHLRAQRSARVAVAEMQMSRPEACAAGRESGDLYLLLKGEIDEARQAFRKQYMTIPSMVDYLHLEMLQVLAEDEEGLLGVEYPGAMV